MTTTPAGPVASTLFGQVLTSTTTPVERVLRLLEETMQLHLQPSGEGATGEVEGMVLRVEALPGALDEPALALLAQLNGVTELVEDALARHSGGFVVTVEEIVDPRAGMGLLDRVLVVLSHLEGAEVVVLPATELLVTPELFGKAMSGELPTTWFNTLAMWVTPETSSLAVTRGLVVFGMPEVQLAGVPWEPVQARGLLHGLVADMLRQGVPIEPGLEFSIGGTPMVLVADADQLTRRPVLTIVPTAALERMQRAEQG